MKGVSPKLDHQRLPEKWGQCPISEPKRPSSTPAREAFFNFLSLINQKVTERKICGTRSNKFFWAKNLCENHILSLDFAAPEVLNRVFSHLVLKLQEMKFIDISFPLNLLSFFKVLHKSWFCKRLKTFTVTKLATWSHGSIRKMRNVECWNKARGKYYKIFVYFWSYLNRSFFYSQESNHRPLVNDC